MPKTTQPNVQINNSQASQPRQASVPQSFLELQARAEALGGMTELAIRLQSVALIYSDFISLFAKILGDFRQSRDLNLSAAAQLLSIDPKTLSYLESADKNYLIETYLEIIDAYRSL